MLRRDPGDFVHLTDQLFHLDRLLEDFGSESTQGFDPCRKLGSVVVVSDGGGNDNFPAVAADETHGKGLEHFSQRNEPWLVRCLRHPRQQDLRMQWNPNPPVTEASGFFCGSSMTGNPTIPVCG